MNKSPHKRVRSYKGKPIRLSLEKNGISNSTEFSSRMTAEAAVVIFGVDIEGRLVEFNKAAQKAFGYNRREIIGIDISLLFLHPEEARRIVRDVQVKGAQKAEVFYLRKDGTCFRSLISASVIHLRRNSTYRIAVISQELEDSAGAYSELAEREKTARILLDSSAESIMLIDHSGIIIDLNELAARSMGGTPADLIGKSLYQLLPADVAADLTEKVDKVIQTELPMRYEEVRDVRIFGDMALQVRFDSTIYPLIDSDNRIQRLAVFSQDMSKRRSAGVSIDSLDQFSGTLVQDMPVGLFRISPGHNGKIIAANLTLARMYGFESLDEFLKSPFPARILNPEEGKDFWPDLIRDGMIKSKEIQLSRQDGSPFLAAVTACTIRDANGKIVCVDGALADISLQKRAEEALQISEERFRNISEETEDWIWEIGPDLVIRYSNPQVQKLLGYDPQEVVGKSLLDFLSEDELIHRDSGADYLLRSVIFTGQGIHMVRKDGQTIVTESSGIPIFRRNRSFVGFQGLTRDITDRIRAAEEEEKRRQMLLHADKMISLGVLVSGVAHEINNPNQSILINTPLLERAWAGITPVIERYYSENGDFQLAGIPYSDLRDRIPGLFAGIRAGSQRIKHIVRDLKDYAREGVYDAKSVIDINAVLKSTLNILDNLLKKSTIALEISISNNLPKVHANFQSIEQVLINLIQNACQALPDPERGISISTSCNPKKSIVLVRIEDEGIGIPESQIKYIFDPFFTTRRESGGTGLGLSISRSIIEDHSGRLEISSKPGIGTCVTVKLPALKEQDGRKALITIRL